MATTNGFNHELDKITERETVYDFVSRLKFGKDVTNTIEHGTTQRTLFSAGTKLKEVISRLVMLLPTYVLKDTNVTKVVVSRLDIPVGSSSVTISKPDGKTLLRAISESTGQDITSCFTLSSNTYKMSMDTPYTVADTVKMYFV